jgi:flagellar basal-body rod protein FlgF
MDRLIYTAMTGANAAAHRQAVLSNNLANASTNGFRAEMSTYRAVPLRATAPPPACLRWRPPPATWTMPGPRSAPAAPGRHGHGNAWFAVQGLDGTEAYTRNGSL